MELHFQSVIFDLDGVVTKTAIIHFKAWKAVFDEYLKLREERDNQPFREFTQQDYLNYVDGKPRYDGVKSFLESRSINIPYGSPEDSPGRETICGIGNRKNRKFLEILEKEGVEVYESTIELIKQLKEKGVKIGVASSSKNCKHILEVAGIERLFETRVDGLVSQKLGLKGKPEPDIFVVASYNLGSSPANSVVVEDATSGVSAGRNGGFGLVLGVARKNNYKDLFENGADIVVSDLSEISLEWMERWFHKEPKPLLKHWEKTDEALRFKDQVFKKEELPFVNPCYFRTAESFLFSKNKMALFLDYDGTLTPIVERPELAVLSSEMYDLLTALSKKFLVAIVSGRSREDVEKLVELDGIFYAGSHGFDIKGPGFSKTQEEAEDIIPVINKITQELKQELGEIPGLLLEEKRFSIAVHYRLVDEGKYLSKIERVVTHKIQDNPQLRLMHGKKVFELLPKIDWNKGKAIRWIMQALEIDWGEYSVIYIGDDVTDEDAFRTIRTRGTAILVSEVPKISCADFFLKSPQEVAQFFKILLDKC
ncbi:MAG TPA: trehalose-phosphatase [Candidatus Omnitrophica bacterium]|nr:trehalose-phosphatase [Candidatus Omnitrophota bacterium]